MHPVRHGELRVTGGAATSRHAHCGVGVRFVPGVPRGVDDDRVTCSSGDPSAIAEAVSAFFAEHGVASLRLPTGWFGRPHDNWHELTGTTTEDENVLVRLDDKQVLTLQAEAGSPEERVLRVAIRGGRWDWTEYGGDQNHTEMLGSGSVEFHAPFRA